jgi:hypothetical protein
MFSSREGRFLAISGVCLSVKMQERAIGGRITKRQSIFSFLKNYIANQVTREFALIRLGFSPSK